MRNILQGKINEVAKSVKNFTNKDEINAMIKSMEDFITKEKFTKTRIAVIE